MACLIVRLILFNSSFKVLTYGDDLTLICGQVID